MATITAKDVMQLRKATGLGMMEAKKALEETGGDIDAAKDLLRQKGLARMDSRSDRESTEGKVAVAVAEDAHKGAIVVVNTETDFTANNEDFAKMMAAVAEAALQQEPGDVQKTDAIQSLIDDVRVTTKENAQFAEGRVFGSPDSKVGSYVHHTGKIGVLIEVAGEIDDELLKQICMHISASNPIALAEDDVPAELVEKEREIAKKQAMESGKPENIAEKMVEGKVRKYYDEVVLLRQNFVLDEKQQIKDVLPKGATIKAFVRYQVGA
jgi:elongation factor Ts